MPCRLRIKIYEARDLPIMDSKSNLTDAYVELHFNDIVERTEVVRHSLNPVWNKAFRFDVSDDKCLQDTPLQIQIWDYDLVSNDIIGAVYIDLNALLHPEANGSVQGWFPIYDTLRGVRGELRLKIRLEFFNNVNAFTDSSAGAVQFFSSSAPLAVYQVEQVLGFAEELLVKQDPEYHWADSFRASRISNQARMLLLYELAGRLRRHIGKKVRDFGGNAVLAYEQHFDMIEKNIVARAYGTAARIVAVRPAPVPPAAAASPALPLLAPPPADSARLRRSRPRRALSSSTSATASASTAAPSVESASPPSSSSSSPSPTPRRHHHRHRRHHRRRRRADEEPPPVPKETPEKEGKERRKRRGSRAHTDSSSSSSSSEAEGTKEKEKEAVQVGSPPAARRRRAGTASSSGGGGSTRKKDSKQSSKAPRSPSPSSESSSSSASSGSGSDSDSPPSASLSPSPTIRRLRRSPRKLDTLQSSDSEPEREREAPREREEKEREERRRRQQRLDKSDSAEKPASSSAVPVPAAQPTASSVPLSVAGTSLRKKDSRDPALCLSPRREVDAALAGRTPLSTSVLSDAAEPPSQPQQQPPPPVQAQPTTTPLQAVVAGVGRREVQLLTLRTLAPDVRLRVGGVVAARSVKLLKSAENLHEQADRWWAELREEVKAHAQALQCSHVLGYSEQLSLQKDLLVLCAYGTAARLKMPPSSAPAQPAPVSAAAIPSSPVRRPIKRWAPCAACHAPYSQLQSPFPTPLQSCGLCRRKLVPEVLLCTMEPPADLAITGTGRLIEARVCRLKKHADGEANAIAVSDALPFLEYDLHQQLISKLKLLGMNAVFGMRMQVAIGETLMVALASGTAVYLPALPAPPPLQIARNPDTRRHRDRQLAQIQERIMKLSEIHREALSTAPSLLHPDITGAAQQKPIEGPPAIVPIEAVVPPPPPQSLASSAASDVPVGASDQTSDSSAFVVEVDDEIDEDTMAVLLEPELPEGVSICTTDTLPGSQQQPIAQLQLLTAIRRVQWNVKEKRINQDFASFFHSLHTAMLFKLRDLAPCCLSNLSTDLQIPDSSSVQIMLTAIAHALPKPKPQPPPPPPSHAADATPDTKSREKKAKKGKRVAREEAELQFSMELEGEEKEGRFRSSAPATPQPQGLAKPPPPPPSAQPSAPQPAQQQQQQLHLARPLVEVTPSSFVPGHRVERFLGRVNLHFVKERMAFKEKSTYDTAEDNLGLFAHELIVEAQAILRAHVLGLGGNAVVEFRFDGLRVNENTDSNNRGYCLISVSGDALATRPLESSAAFKAS